MLVAAAAAVDIAAVVDSAAAVELVADFGRWAQFAPGESRVPIRTVFELTMAVALQLR